MSQNEGRVQLNKMDHSIVFSARGLIKRAADGLESLKGIKILEAKNYENAVISMIEKKLNENDIELWERENMGESERLRYVLDACFSLNQEFLDTNRHQLKSKTTIGKRQR